MSITKLLDQLLENESPEIFLKKFSKLRPDIQIALYQKLLYKAGEAPKLKDGEAPARALATLSFIDFVDETNGKKTKLNIEYLVKCLEVKTNKLRVEAAKHNSKGDSTKAKPFEESARYYENAAQNLPKAFAIECERYKVAKANALYQDYLYQKALTNAKTTSDPLLFDPQGRLVYELTLREKEQKEVLEQIEKKLGITHTTEDTTKTALQKILGRMPTDTTLCSIDLSGAAPEGQKEAYDKLRTAYETIYGPGSIAAIPSYKRASIVASFEEINAHMTLMAKTYEHNFPAKAAISPDDWTKIRQETSLKIQEEVGRIYQEAAKKASEGGILDVEKLNAHLVKARVDLAHFAKKTVVKEVIEHLKTTKKQGKKTILAYMAELDKNLNEHSFTERTATGFDYFHISDYLQQGMLISGTNNTAHDKPKFAPDKGEAQAAYRQITYTYRDQNGTIQPTGRVSARLPSPALVFDSSMKHSDIINDLQDKFGFLHDQMRAMRGGKHGPVVENLFTSFHSQQWEKRVDWKNNRQRTSALCMMQAMHGFNAEQYRQNPSNHDYLYVQNIGTNRHTRDLGYLEDRYFGGSPELDDLTLSAEMAMLHSLQENSAYLNPRVQWQIKRINETVLNKYNLYLTQFSKEPYFAQSPNGQSLITSIRLFKETLKTSLKANTLDHDLPSLASNALAHMFANNKHWNARTGQLAQALSMYVEWASTGGCKSGNERNQDVMARFSLLTSIHERVEHAGNMNGLQEHEKEIYRQLETYSLGQNKKPEALRAAISISIREANLHGGVAAISREDQGGAAKINSFSLIQDINNPILHGIALVGALVDATVLAIGALLISPFLPKETRKDVKKYVANQFVQLFDTNNAADREMRLNAAGASKTQAHKDQDEYTRKAIAEVLKEDPYLRPNDLTTAQEAPFKTSSTLKASLLLEGNNVDNVIKSLSEQLPSPPVSSTSVTVLHGQPLGEPTIKAEAVSASKIAAR